MIGKLQCVVLDCADVRQLAGFYQALLGGTVNRPDSRWAVGDDFATLHIGSDLVLGFQRVADHRAPRWPDPAYPQQFHLDIQVADPEVAHARTTDAGAVLLHVDQRGWKIYADPAGHPFCLLPG